MTTYEPIPKPQEALRVTPNLVDWGETYARFTWEAERAELEGLPEGRGLNIAHEAVDRHARSALAEKVATRRSASPRS